MALLISPAAQGAFSEVKLAIERSTGQMMAVKMLDKFKVWSRPRIALAALTVAAPHAVHGRHAHRGHADA